MTGSCAVSAQSVTAATIGVPRAEMTRALAVSSASMG
jgi:hypothetical protein